MPPSLEILLDGVSILSKVKSLRLERRRDQAVDTLTLGLADYSLYSEFDFGAMPAAERIEVLTGPDPGSLVSQGKFFAEKPDVLEDKNQVSLPSLWGRNRPARLTDPFAAKITRTWKSKTTMHAVVKELVRQSGMDNAQVQIDIDDYDIPANLLSATEQYPLQIIIDLAARTNGYVRCKKSGDLWIKKDLFHFDALPVALAIDDAKLQGSATERVEYPEFGNRILIRSSVAASTQPLRVTIKSPESCLRGDGRARMEVEAIVVDSEGKPAGDGTPVDWTIDNGALAFFGFATTLTGEKVIISEPQRSSGLFSLSTDYPIGKVVGVFLEEDFHKDKNLFTGGSFEGSQIALVQELTFTDSRLVVDYVAKGVARSTLFTRAGAPEQETEIHAAVGKVRDSTSFCINNQRNVSIRLSADITEHNICVPGQRNSQIIASVEIDGQGGSGAMVQWFVEGDGAIAPKFSPVSNRVLNGEVGRSISTFEVATKHKIVSVIGVWLLAAGRAGTNFYTNEAQRKKSFVDNRITLGTDLPSDGAQVLIDYRAKGVATATFTATEVIGKSTVIARLEDGTTANVEESIEIEVVNRCSNLPGNTPRQEPGGKKDCSASVPSAAGCGAASYPNIINATVEECICRQESFGSPCPESREDCEQLCDEMYGRYGLDPLSCQARVTEDERRKMEIQLGRTIPRAQANAYKDCAQECAKNNGGPECIDPCVTAHRETTVDRCAQRCADHGLIISPAEGSIQCNGSKSITFTAKGGTPPYSWSGGVGSLEVAEGGASATLKPPTNNGAGVPGTAYTKQLCFFGTGCLSCNAPNFSGSSGQGYNCDDSKIGDCAQHGAALASCDAPDDCIDTGVMCSTEPPPACEEAAGCEGVVSCQEIQKRGKILDTRTPEMIAQGCSPCATAFDQGGTVTVRDSKGLSATAVVNP